MKVDYVGIAVDTSMDVMLCTVAWAAATLLVPYPIIAYTIFLVGLFYYRHKEASLHEDMAIGGTIDLLGAAGRLDEWAGELERKEQ